MFYLACPQFITLQFDLCQLQELLFVKKQGGGVVALEPGIVPGSGAQVKNQEPELSSKI